MIEVAKGEVRVGIEHEDGKERVMMRLEVRKVRMEMDKYITGKVVLE